MGTRKFEGPLGCGNCPNIIFTTKSLSDEYDLSTVPNVAPCMGCIIFDP